MESRERNTNRSEDHHNLVLELSLRPPLPEENSAANQHSLRPPLPDENFAANQQPEPASQPILFPMPPVTPQTWIPHRPSTSSLNNLPANVDSSNAMNHSKSQSSRPRRRTSASASASPSGRESPRRRRCRTRPRNTPIKPPYPWSTEYRAVIHNLNYLRSNKILSISGDVKCRRCEKQYKIEYDLLTKFEEIARFIERNRDTLHNRAPESWITPELLNCKLCNKQNCVEPLIINPENKENNDNDDEDEDEDEDDHKNINWLFLLLGQMLGRLSLKQLKYFCTYANIHRTGAKNRLLYLTYLALCSQLDPSAPLFHL